MVKISSLKNYLSRTLSIIVAAVSVIAFTSITSVYAASTASSLPFPDPSSQTTNEFGYVVSLSQNGNTAVVTAPMQDDTTDGVTAEGAAYIYQFSSLNNSWSEVAQLNPSQLLPNYYFGNSAYITPDGTKVIVGAFNPQAAEPTGNGQPGAAYIYNVPQDNGGNPDWTSSSPIQPTSSLYGVSPQDNFGSSVTLSANGSTAVVGADTNQDGTSTPSIGSAYIYNNNNNVWTLSSTIYPQALSANNEFGTSVASSSNGSTVMVGVPEQGSSSQGYVEIYNEPTNGWSSSPTVTNGTVLHASDGAINNLFGESIAISGDGSTAIIGSPGYTPKGSPNGDYSYGSAYSFNNSSGSWTQTQELVAPDNGPFYNYGLSVAIAQDGSSMLVGAPSQTVGGNTNVGEAYQYTPGASPGTWNIINQLFPSSDNQGQDFGWSLSVVNSPIYGNSFVGAPGINATPSSDAKALISQSSIKANDSGTSSGGGVYQFDTLAPTFTSFSDQYVGAGQQLTISGGHLCPSYDQTCSATQVYFGTKLATNVQGSDNYLTVTVPAGAPNKIKIVTPNGKTASIPYNVGPSITSLSTTLAGEGDTVVIKGQNLANVTSATFNNEAMTIVKNSSTSLSVVLPLDATSPGNITLIANGDSVTSSQQVTIGTPTISSIPAQSSVGKKIAIKGSYIGGTSQVIFNSASGTVAAQPSSVSSSTVDVTIPTGAVSGPITVVTGFGNISSNTTINIK